MRARYAAYALNHLDYVMDTTHPDSPHYRADREAWRRELSVFSTTTQFIGLIVKPLPFDADDETAYVKFDAQLQSLNGDISFSEKSLFQKHAGRWHYVQAIEDTKEDTKSH